MNNELKIEIELDLKNMERITDETNKLLAALGGNSPDVIQLTALSSFASQFYNGFENILKRIHKHNNLTLPKGENWHIQLIKRFSADDDFPTPIKIDNELYSKLSDLRRFRHYFFHGYSFHIDWEVLRDSINELDIIFTKFKMLLINEKIV